MIRATKLWLAGAAAGASATVLGFDFAYLLDPFYFRVWIPAALLTTLPVWALGRRWTHGLLLAIPLCVIGVGLGLLGFYVSDWIALIWPSIPYLLVVPLVIGVGLLLLSAARMSWVVVAIAVMALVVGAGLELLLHAPSRPVSITTAMAISAMAWGAQTVVLGRLPARA